MEVSLAWNPTRRAGLSNGGEGRRVYEIDRSIWKKNRRPVSKVSQGRRHFRANTRKSQSLRLSKVGQVVGGVRSEGN